LRPAWAKVCDTSSQPIAEREAEIGRMVILSQFVQKSLQDCISTEKSWVWWQAPFIPASVGSIKGKTVVQASLDKKQDQRNFFLHLEW
jgi:hypothetical protein